MDVTRLYWVDIGYACFGLEAKQRNGIMIIERAAPIAKQSIGKSAQSVIRWYIEKKQAMVLWCNPQKIEWRQL